MSPFMTLHHGASALGRVRRRLFAFITAVTLVAPLLLIGAMPVAATLVYADPAQTTIEAAAASASVEDPGVLITVVLRDSAGDPTGEPEGPVTLSSDLAGSSLTEPFDEGNGTWSATLTSTATGDANISGTLDGSPIGFGTTVSFTPGAADPTTTTITAEAAPLTVDDPNADLTLQLKDQYGNNLIAGGGDVVLADDAANADITGLADNGDGTWSATLSLSNNIPTVVGVTGTLDEVAITDTESVDFLPGALASFTIDTISNQTAGGAFNVDATAYDGWGNIKTDYAGGATVGASIGSGLSTSPACTSCASGASAPSYGAFGTWAGGAATASVTAYAAETGRTVTVADGAVTVDSNSFDVGAAAATNAAFADSAITFDGQPSTTKKGTNISHVSGGSAPVQAIVRDAYGNPISGAGVTLTAPTKPSGSSLTGAGTASTTGTDGIASFSPISVSPGTATGTVQLSVGVDSTAISALSNAFELVDDLEACTGSTCDNLANNSNGNSQSSYGKITSIGGVSDGGIGQQTGGALDGVTLVTQFQTSSANCTGLTTQIGKTTDVHIEAAGGAPTLDYQVALIIPKGTLQASGVASRNIAAFNVCFGATYLGAGTATPWKAKTSPTNITLVDAVGPDGGGLYWGWLPDCSTGGKKSPPALSAENPCISLRTKNADQLRSALGMSKAQFVAVGFSSGDLALVYRTKTPWDAKGSVF